MLLLPADGLGLAHCTGERALFGRRVLTPVRALASKTCPMRDDAISAVRARRCTGDRMMGTVGIASHMGYQ
eukprot:6183804-Pleurochrysis_carterae.AAC.3